MQMNIAAQIKKARLDKGLSQAQLGIACGWDSGNPQSRVGNYEQGKRIPSAPDIVVLAKALDKSITYFFNEDDANNYKKDTQVAEQSPDYKAQPRQLTEADTALLKEVIFNIERKKFNLNAEQKARLITGVFASCINHGLTATDLSDTLIDAVRFSVK